MAKLGDKITDGTVQWQIRKGVTLPYELPEYMETLLDDKDAETARATLGAPSMTGANASGSWNINAATATKLATPRKIELTGNVTGSAAFDGSKDIQIATSLADVSALAHSLLSKTTAADMRGVIEANAQNCGGIVAESLTSPGYVKFANGLLIEWGQVLVDHAPGTDGIDTAYHRYWVYPIKMSVPIGWLATDVTGNMPDPQPFCTWAINDVWGVNVNCKIADRYAFVLAIGIA